MLCVPQVPSQSAGWRDGALSGPEAGNRSAEEETGRAGRETHGQDPGAVQVSSVKKVQSSFPKVQTGTSLPHINSECNTVEFLLRLTAE